MYAAFGVTVVLVPLVALNVPPAAGLMVHETVYDGAVTEPDRLTVLDVAPFASYCQAYARWKEAEEFITQHGSIVKTKSGYWQQVPQVSIAHSNQKIMMQAASEFGLTPSARSRMIAGDKKEAETDEMECILSV